MTEAPCRCEVLFSHDDLIEIAENAVRKKRSVGGSMAEVLIHACRYGIIVGKRAECARRKRSKK